MAGTCVMERYDGDWVKKTMLYEVEGVMGSQRKAKDDVDSGGGEG